MPSNKVKRVRVWAVISPYEGMVGVPNCFVVEAKEIAEAHAKYWKKQLGEDGFKVVVATITYSLPSPKIKGKKK